MDPARDTCAPELTRNLWGKNFRKLPKTTIIYYGLYTEENISHRDISLIANLTKGFLPKVSKTQLYIHVCNKYRRDTALLMMIT